MRSFFNRLTLSAKVMLMTLAALVALSAGLFAGTSLLLRGNAATKALERQEAHMRVAWHVLDGYGQEFSAGDQGLFAGGQKLNDFHQPVDKIKALVGGTATIFEGDKRVATNVTKPDGSRAVGTTLAPGPVYDAVLGRGEKYRGTAEILGTNYFTAYDPIKDKSGKVVGILYVGIPTSDFLSEVEQVEAQLGWVALLVTVAASLACLWFARLLFRPLVGMQQAMQQLADGAENIEIPGLGRQDEIGKMAQTLVVFRDAAVARRVAEEEVRRGAAEQRSVADTLGACLEAMRAGDLTCNIAGDFPPAYVTLRNNFNAALDALRALIGAVSESADSIRTGSDEIAQASEDLARRTETNAASLAQTTAAISGIETRIKASAEAAGRTVDRADQAISVVGDGRAVADEAVQAMGRVSESARGIDSVIEGLDKIAFQTRVLAMNAAVEAGRAGEAGRGFAVVADLVSALAMRAEEEAKRARDQLTVTQSEVVTAVEAVRKVDGALARIVDDVTAVHGLLGSMAADNQAQAAAIDQISTAVNAMDQATQQNAAMVEQTSAAARNLTSEVATMREQTARFTVSGGGARRQAMVPVAVRPMKAAQVAALRRPDTAAGDWAEF